MAIPQKLFPFARKKTAGGLENGLANLWRRKKITKETHADRGPEAKGGNPQKNPCRVKGKP